MTLENTNPIQHFTANGETSVFAFEFEVENKDNIKVTLDGEAVPIYAYEYDESVNAVVFNFEPENGSEVIIERVTSLERSINYQTYNNSFRPETLNYDLDRIWHVLQEQNIVDAEILARLKDEIDWRRNLDLNYDVMAQVRDTQVFGALKQYLDTIIASTSPNVFGGVTAGVVFALDKKSVQTHLEDIYQKFIEERQALQAEKDRAIAAEQGLDQKIEAEKTRAKNVEANLQANLSAVAGGNYGFNTYADFDAVKSSLPNNVVVRISEDAQYQGDNIWNGTTLTKSPYDSRQETINFIRLLNNGTLPSEIYEDLTSEATSYGYINTLGVHASKGDTNWLTSDFHEIGSSYKKVEYKIVGTTLVSSIAFYTDTYDFIIGYGDTISTISKVAEGSVQIPINAKYIRITLSNKISTGITQNDLDSQFVKIIKYSNVYIEEKLSEIDSTLENLRSGDLEASVDIWQYATIQGYYIAGGATTGVSDKNWVRSDLIKISNLVGDGSENKRLRLRCTGHSIVKSLLFFDASKNLLEEHGATENTSNIYQGEFVVPEEAKYLAVSGGSSQNPSGIKGPYAYLMSQVSVVHEILELKNNQASKEYFPVLSPIAVYTTCNDMGDSQNKGRLRNYSTAIYLDHFFNGLASEKDVKFKHAQDRYVFTPSLIVTDSNENKPTIVFNEGVNAKEKSEELVLVGDDVVDTTVSIKHRSALNSVTATVTPKVLCIGDSITYGEQALIPDDNYTQNHSYHLITKELFIKDKVDNDNQGFDALFLGTKSKTKTFSYKG
ncbi:hypothetical protein HLH17_04510, partial [Acinetobacter sp. ANC 5380]|nr:hypothetical protein [Acinetobacter terrae]